MKRAAGRGRIAVVGAGVIGLTSGIRLLEAGFEVTLFARELPPGTTSDVAAAFWAPGGASERAAAWCLESLRTFRELARAGPAGTVRLVALHELADAPFRPAGLELAGDARPIEPGSFPAPWSHGYTLTGVRIDVPSYMPFLLDRFRSLGGAVEAGPVNDLGALTEPFPAVVNCAGIGARALAPDPSVHPVRGQVVRIRKPPGLPPDIIHANAGATTTYVVPRERDVILGGSYRVGDDRLEVDDDLAASILERTAIFHPALEEVEVLEHRVGLRPGRGAVRLEQERVAGGVVIHNYGHGSVGHTLSWGCAAEVVKLIRELR